MASQRHRRLPRVVAAALAACLALACRPTPQGAPDGGPRNVITREQLDASGATNMYDVIARLHPEFLNDRGRVSVSQNIHSRAVVFIDVTEYGIPETLRSLTPTRFAEVRYFTGLEALTKFGASYGGGVIQLVSRVE